MAALLKDRDVDNVNSLFGRIGSADSEPRQLRQREGEGATSGTHTGSDVASAIHEAGPYHNVPAWFVKQLEKQANGEIKGEQLVKGVQLDKHWANDSLVQLQAVWHFAIVDYISTFDFVVF